jgi:hypothetical protein
MSLRLCQAKISVRPASHLHCAIKRNLRMSGGVGGVQLSARYALTRRDARRMMSSVVGTRKNIGGVRKALERVCRLMECRLQRLKAESALEKNLDKLLEGVLS